MQADGLFIITCIIFIFLAWVATGGPTRPISQAGPFITPVTSEGEQSQGYRITAPANPINSASYPHQVTGASNNYSTSTANLYNRTPTASGN